MRSPEGAKYPIWAYFAALWRQNYKRELDDLCGRFLHSRPSKNTFLGLALTFTVFEGGPPQKPCVARTKIVYRSKFSGEILFQLMFCLSNIAVLLYNLVLNFDFHARPSYKLNKICYCKVKPFILHSHRDIHIEIRARDWIERRWVNRPVAWVVDGKTASDGKLKRYRQEFTST